MSKRRTISVPFTDPIALSELADRLSEVDKQVKHLARLLCLASDDPKPNRSLSPKERRQYMFMAKMAIAYMADPLHFQWP